jgi:hypothetical protein
MFFQAEMTETVNVRKERIERLLNELRYEVTRGMLDREIGEEMGFEFIVPISQKVPDGMVFCAFRTRPMSQYNIASIDPTEPRLKVVK